MQNILNLHPMVNCKGEFHFEAIWRGYEAFTAQPWFLASRPRIEIATDSVQDIVRRMMYARREQSRTLWLGDRRRREWSRCFPGAGSMASVATAAIVSGTSTACGGMRSPDRVWEGIAPSGGEAARRSARMLLLSSRRGKGFLLRQRPWFRAHARVWAEGVLHDLKAAPLLRGD